MTQPSHESKLNTHLTQSLNSLYKNTYTWLVTGAAGFIGSHITEQLLLADQIVVGVDRVSAGPVMHEIRKNIGKAKLQKFTFIKEDLNQLNSCKQIFNKSIDFVIHQAADASVSSSMQNPSKTYQDNVTSHLNVMIAAKDAKVKRMIYASSSAVYGDCPDMPCIENNIGNALSPYALSKYINEINADLFHRLYGLESIGLRYFNVYGPRQCMNGPVNAVIPAWVQALVENCSINMNGNGEQTRDFCYVKDVVNANLLAAFCDYPKQVSPVFNIGSEREISLLNLLHLIEKIGKEHGYKAKLNVKKRDFQKGDIVQSYGSINRAKKYLHFKPTYSLEEGLNLTFQWFWDKKKLDRVSFLPSQIKSA
jgi:UDP-N-acetylglucosamine 4-epimerase